MVRHRKMSCGATIQRSVRRRRGPEAVDGGWARQQWGCKGVGETLTALNDSLITHWDKKRGWLLRGMRMVTAAVPG